MVDSKHTEENEIAVECGGTNLRVSFADNINTNEDSTHADLDGHERHEQGEKRETSFSSTDRNLLRPFAKLKSFVVPKVERIPVHVFILLTFFIALP